jgi:hypothetical protein
MSLIWAFLFFIYPVSTDEINTDGKGLFYNISPILPEKGTVYLLIYPRIGYGERTGPCDTTSHIPNDQRRKPVDGHYYGTATVDVGWVILPTLEVFLGSHGYVPYIERKSWPLKRSDTRYIVFPQLLLGVKTGFPQQIDSYILSFGFVLWCAYWVDALVRKPPAPALREEFYDIAPREIKQDIEVGIRGMTSLKTPIGTTYLNLGHLRIIGKGKQGGFNSFGIGQELDLWHYVHPGIEVAKQDTFGCVIPQIKFPIPYITISFGLSFPVFANFDWIPNDTLEKTPRLLFSLNPHFIIKRPPKPKPTIVITGTIYDSVSLAPLPATISFMGPVSGKIEVRNGEYRLEFVKEGAYQIGVESPDFEWNQRVFHLMAYDTVHADWPLIRNILWSMVGRVLDVKTKKGIPATIRLIGKKSVETQSDPKSGEYKIWTNSGVYKLHVSAEGYHPKEERVKIITNKTIQKNIYLLSTKFSEEARKKPKEEKKKKGKKGRRKKR